MALALTTERAPLLHTLGTVLKTVERTTTIPVLGHLLIEAVGYQHAGASYIATLNETIEIQAEEIRQLREILNPPRSVPVSWGLTPHQSRMIHAIARGNGSPVNRERIASFVYGSQYHDRNTKVFDVMLCQIRKKTPLHGLTIHTANCFGPYMSPEDCALVRGYFEAPAEGVRP